MNQLILLLSDTPATNPVNDLVLQQDLAFKQFLLKLRQEHQELMTIRRILYPDFGRLQDTKIDRLKVICTIWRTHHGIPPPPKDDRLPKSSKIQKPIVQ
jgi:hypothetical protein